MTAEPVLTRLLKRVEVTEHGCWEFSGHRDRWGYGRIGVDGRTELTHRVTYRLMTGPIPDGLFVCHRCDNPPCCNPAHLFIGTAADNTADAKAKGRLHKVPPQEVAAAYLAGEPARALASRFGLDLKNVYRALAAQGVTLRPKKEEGYRNGVDQAAVVALRSQGRTLEAIASHLGIGVGTVRGVLKDHHV